MNYKLYVGVNYPDGKDKNIECNPEDVVKTVQIMQDIIMDEKDATGFVFTIQVENGATEDVSARNNQTA